MRTGTFIGESAILMPSCLSVLILIQGLWSIRGQLLAPAHKLVKTYIYPVVWVLGCFVSGKQTQQLSKITLLARSEVVNVIVEEGAVLSMGVYIGQSTKIYDRETGEIHYGRVLKHSVVVPGTLLLLAVNTIYMQRLLLKKSMKTRARVGINEILREVS